MMYRYFIEESKSKLPTLVAVSNDRKYYLHSRYNPEIESENIIAKYALEKYDYIVLLGLGLGYVLNKIQMKNIKLFVVEKDMKIYEIYKKIRKEQLTDVQYFIAQPVETVVNSILSQFNISKNKGIVVIETPSLVRLYPDYYENLKRELNYKIEQTVNYQMTVAKLFNCVVQNFLKNLQSINKFKIIKFDKEKARNQYALIVSAGPSLSKDIKALKKIEKNVHIFSADTAAKYLLANNIIPDFIFSVDPQYESRFHFENIVLPINSIVVLDIFSNFMLLKKLKNIALIISNNLISQKIFPDFEWLLDPAGGSVTNYIFQFVKLAGFEKIIFIGLDFSYPEKKMYIPYNYIVDYWLKRIDRFDPLDKLYFLFYKNRAKAEITFNGKKYKTSHSMIEYFKWLKNNIIHQQNIMLSDNSIASIENVEKIELTKYRFDSIKTQTWIETDIDYTYFKKAEIEFKKNKNLQKEITELLNYSKYFNL